MSSTTIASVFRPLSACVSLTAALLALAPAQSLRAHGGGGDIAVFTTNGQADVGFAELDEFDINQVSFDPTRNVFQAILVPLPAFLPFDFGSSEPGYDANEGQLPPDAVIAPVVVDLSYWDGSGAVNFTPAIDVEAGYDPPTTVADSLGGFHKHYLFGLRNLSGDVPEGVYLAELQMSVTGLANSDSFYLVTLVDQQIALDADSEGAAEDLGEAVRNYLADPSLPAPMIGTKSYAFYANAIAHTERIAAIPEPAASILAACAWTVSIVRRRPRSKQ